MSHILAFFCGVFLMGIIAFIIDRVRVDQIRSKKQDILTLSAHPITGMLNRIMFDNHFIRVFTAYKKKEGDDTQGNNVFSLLFLDLDGFKDVNDQHGHQSGDDALRLIGERLQRSIRPGDMVFHWGGDEFAIIIPRADALQLHTRVREIKLAINKPFGLNGTTIRIGVSIGMVTGPKGFENQSDMLLAADRAMYAAKQDGKDQVFRYQSGNGHEAHSTFARLV